jgi:uncharacterized protein YcnI
MSASTLPTRVLAGLAAGAVLAVAVPLAASAHVTITPDQAEAGGWTYVTFRVPTESDTASTTGLDVHLPADAFSSVTYQPTPGWSATVTDDTISFAADGDGIAPGEFQTFTVALGPVPDVGHVVLPATQTYDDGTVVEWDATPEELADDDTLEPAPVLWVNDAPPADAHGATAETDATADVVAAPDSGLAIGLSIAALVVAAAGVLLAAVGIGRTRRARS